MKPIALARRTTALLVIIVGVANIATKTEANDLDIAQTISHSWLEQDCLTGDWFGLRNKLGGKGISISAENVFEYSGVLDGGINQTDSSRNLFVAELELDTRQAIGLPGGTFFIQFLSVTREEGGSNDAGDIQGYTNIENYRSLDEIYELWYQQVLFDGIFRAKIGKVDANTEFAYVASLQELSSAGELTHSSAGFQPTIAGFPSYPDPAMSVNLFLTPINVDGHRFSLAYGLYDGAAGVDGIETGSRGPSTFFNDDRSDDYFHIIEGQYAWDQLGGLPGGSLSVGGWLHTGDWQTFNGTQEDGITGLYATFQQQVIAPDEEVPEHGLYLFAQYGLSDDEVVEVGQVFSVGSVLNGVCKSRPDDVIGLYASLADLSDKPAAGFERDELAIEALYRFMITPAVSIQPGVQYIINPSGDPAVDDIFVGQIRFSVAL